MQANDLPCHGRQRAFIFDGRKDDGYHQNVASAKALCGVCPMRQACLDRWLANDWDPMGTRDEVIVGGTTLAERAAMRKRTPGDHEHGTVAGHSAHLRHATVPCRPCRDAYNLHQRTRRQAARAVAA